ncbi:hypothetical protein [Sphaerimonospora thailandensis]|uniref:Uncharacterized protein n=1 Tax=Sphaerimonospora thailandensis TaxID=795644 RepID=A0A8J3VYP6_9ACTN|nr:hypothetical protein [Sphaerimonospora thailandensis]GIH70279.1 hypothetical protein Mth01_25320 [Sphaerimonospora thailandensis]
MAINPDSEAFHAGWAAAADWPPLTEQEIARLVLILRPGGTPLLSPDTCKGVAA